MVGYSAYAITHTLSVMVFMLLVILVLGIVRRCLRIDAIGGDL